MRKYNYYDANGTRIKAGDILVDIETGVETLVEEFEYREEDSNRVMFDLGEIAVTQIWLNKGYPKEYYSLNEYALDELVIRNRVDLFANFKKRSV